ncbi:hypothetical protein ILYODFUR_030221 [Ilyodon furcidens]|uniref:Uncharacterized protein n=1 Tax=Ilyodon furcidens TaxID=33524 RepID=A0ABV0V823_9TELE
MATHFSSDDRTTSSCSFPLISNLLPGGPCGTHLEILLASLFNKPYSTIHSVHTCCFHQSRKQNQYDKKVQDRHPASHLPNLLMGDLETFSGQK